MALQPWRTGKIIRIENETSDTRRFWIEIPELTVFDFVPGQFVTFDLPIHEKSNQDAPNPLVLAIPCVIPITIHLFTHRGAAIFRIS